MRTLSLLSLLAALTALVPVTTVTAAKEPCETSAYAAQYAAIRAKYKDCEAMSGVAMVLPLVNKQKLVLCDKCPELKLMAQERTAPPCTVVVSNTTIMLRQELRRLFKPCMDAITSGSDSEPDSGSQSAASAAPATTTAPPVATTKTPIAPTATSSGSGTSGTDGTTSNSTSNAAASKTTPKPTSGTGGSSSTQTANTESSSISTGVIIGVIVGVVAVVLVAAIFLVMRRRRKNSDSDKLEDSSLDSSTGRATTSHYQFSLVSGTTKSSKQSSRSRPSSSIYQPSPMANLWEDEVIVASRIPKDKVMPTVLLSRGGFGEVYQGIYNREPVAIKTLLPEHRKNMKQINAFLYEVKLMASLEHDRIVNFIGVAWDSLNDVCVVSEYMEGGDLRGVLINFEQMGRRHGFDNEKIKIALHVAHALTYLHSLRPLVLHRDLKSKNILLDSQLNAKLTDFGVSRERSDTTTMTAGVGTSLWMAPEVMMGERYDDKADIFSFGVVLSELDTHSVPYGQVKETESGRRIPDSAVLQMVSLGRLKVKFTTEGSIPEMIELGNACVALNPRDRPNAADALYTLHNILKSMFAVM